MFGRSIPLFRILGFEVRLDISWIVIAVLVTWSLAAGLFPEMVPGLDPVSYWVMGAVGALGLFASIVLHELGHSVVARRNGIAMRGITLFIFGGVAHMDREPPTPRAEFFTAIGGPIVTVGLAIVFAFAQFALAMAGSPAPVVAVLGYLAWINLILLVFNLVPAFPLDGGRVLRAALWAWKKDIRKATRIASILGSGFGFFLIAMGVFSFVTGNFIGGLWWFLIGLFIRHASEMSYKQVVFQQALQGEPLRRFMHPEPVVLFGSQTIASAVDDVVYRHYHKLYPVVENGRLVGCLTLDQIKSLPKEQRELRTVGELAQACSDENTIAPDADAADALARMQRSGRSRLIVVEGGELAGIISLRDLMQFLSLKRELEGDDVRPPPLESSRRDTREPVAG